MKKTLTILAALLCCAAGVVNAQTAEEETSSERYLRLSNYADEHQDDWKAQLEVGRILTDKSNGFHNASRAVRYYDRIYRCAVDHNQEMPDSVLAETVTVLVSQPAVKKDPKKGLFYVDELLRADRNGRAFNVFAMLSIETFGILFTMPFHEPWKSLNYMMDMRQRVSKNNIPGIEYMDMMTAYLFELVMAEYKKLFGDKLPEITIDGKKYIAISMKNWNIEQPFLLGWLGSLDDTEGPSQPLLFYGEDGKVYDDVKNGGVYGSFKFTEKVGKVEPQEDHNTILISVTPERRQEMVDAYRRYMKKAKKK